MARLFLEREHPGCERPARSVSRRKWLKPSVNARECRRASPRPPSTSVVPPRGQPSLPPCGGGFEPTPAEARIQGKSCRLVRSCGSSQIRRAKGAVPAELNRVPPPPADRRNDRREAWWSVRHLPSQVNDYRIVKERAVRRLPEHHSTFRPSGRRDQAQSDTDRQSQTAVATAVPQS